MSPQRYDYLLLTTGDYLRLNNDGRIIIGVREVVPEPREEEGVHSIEDPRMRDVNYIRRLLRSRWRA